MDPYERIVPFYDLEHDAFVEDRDFYLNLIQEGPVLEIGCGTGRIIEPLARAGLETHGIETSAAMLAAARRRLQGVPNAHLHQMSATALSLPDRFAWVIWPLNVLWHLTELETQIRALRAARAHSIAGGSIVVDLSNPLTMQDRQNAGEVRRRFGAKDGDDDVSGFSSAHDVESEQLLEIDLWYERVTPDGALRRSTTSLALRYTYRFELQLMLEAAGYRVRQLYGSYDLEPYDSDAPNLLLVGEAI